MVHGFCPLVTPTSGGFRLNCQTHKLTFLTVFLQNFSLQNKHKSLLVKLAGEWILFIHSVKLEKFSTLKNTPFPLNQSIKVHRRALVLLLCLIPCLRCEKSARESRNSHHFITQRANIHARAQDTCVDQRGYMTSGWRNLF